MQWWGVQINGIKPNRMGMATTKAEPKTNSEKMSWAAYQQSRRLPIRRSLRVSIFHSNGLAFKQSLANAKNVHSIKLYQSLSLCPLSTYQPTNQRTDHYQTEETANQYQHTSIHSVKGPNHQPIHPFILSQNERLHSKSGEATNHPTMA